MSAQGLFSVEPKEVASKGRLLKRGERFMEPDVLLRQENGTPEVIKDYRRYRGTAWAPLAAWLVRRERRFLTLACVRGISPAPLPSADRLILAMDWVDGRSPQRGDEALLLQARGLLNRMHAQGVVHNDVHGSNVLIAEGQVVLLDWASAVGRSWWVPEWLLTQLHERDLAHVTKMVAKLSGRSLTASERQEQTPPVWVRIPVAVWRRLYRRN